MADTVEQLPANGGPLAGPQTSIPRGTASSNVNQVVRAGKGAIQTPHKDAIAAMSTVGVKNSGAQKFKSKGGGVSAKHGSAPVPTTTKHHAKRRHGHR